MFKTSVWSNSTSRPEDRRKHPRFRIPQSTVTVTLRKLLGYVQKPIEHNAPIINVSKGGINFQGSQPVKKVASNHSDLRLQNKLDLSLYFPAFGYSLDATARVIWMQRVVLDRHDSVECHGSLRSLGKYYYEVGCSFIKLDNHVLTRIHRLWLLWAKSEWSGTIAL